MLRRSIVSLACLLIIISAGSLRAEDQFFDSNGVKIRYTVEGKGEPVLLIHGFTANIEFQWVVPGVLKALAKDYQVIALDNRGHGKSGKPHDPKQYGTEMVEDAVRLLVHLKIQKAHVVGYSMGAMLTCKLVTSHPDRLLSATLGGAAGIREGADTSFFDTLAQSLDEGKGLAPLIVALTPAGRPKPTEEQLKFMNQMLTATNDTKALAAVVRSWKGLTVSDEKLKANQVPTLSLIGEVDPLKRGVDELRERMSHLHVVVIDRADHMNAFAHPEFIKSLKEFLAKHSPRKRGQTP